MTGTKQTLVYCRLSKEDKEKGAGFDVQERELRRKIDDRKDLVSLDGYGCNQDMSPREDGFFFEDFSGTGVRKRKIFWSILVALCGECNGEDGMCYSKAPQGNALGLGAILVYDTDRLARNTEEFLKLKRFFTDHKVELVVAMGVQFQDPDKPRAMEEGMQEMKAVFDSLYPKFVRDKVRDAYDQKVNVERRWWGRIPPGFKVRSQDGKIEPKTAMVVQVIRYLIMGYNPYQIGELGLAENIDGKYINYNWKRMYKLRDTLRKEAEKYGKNGRIILPDSLYDIKPLTSHTLKRKNAFLLQNVHAASVVSEMEIAQNPNRIPAKVQQAENRFWRSIGKEAPQLLPTDSEQENDGQSEGYTSPQTQGTQEKPQAKRPVGRPRKIVQPNHQKQPQPSSQEEKAVSQGQAKSEESFEPMFSD
jgi:DNA invertase Pin-like site-specific DNA recombinase